MSNTSTAEIAFRANDGVEVSLPWGRASGRLTVVVSDTRAGDTFELATQPQNALDVFYHPYAYAAAQGIGYAVGATAASLEVVAA
jgi:hypothetical protein